MLTRDVPDVCWDIEHSTSEYICRAMYEVGGSAGGVVSLLSTNDTGKNNAEGDVDGDDGEDDFDVDAGEDDADGKRR